MSETWFTSDTHFGHKNILVYEKEARPFQTLEEMHETLIHNWNSVVGDNDTVYHLGDFCFGRDNIRIARLLKGKKHLIMGNHDSYTTHDYLQYFYKLHGCKYWERCVLTHMPVHPNGLGGRWMLNIHGHLHSRNVIVPELEFTPDPNYFNVSVEQNNLFPFHADVIRQRVKELD